MKLLSQKNFKNKKALVFGLGLLGGGVATTNWLLNQGARVTVTDLKDKKALAVSLKKIKGRVKLRLGGHSEKDIKDSEVIVVNPDVSINSPYIQIALKSGKRVENEATIFCELFDKPMVAITGTRGKTTTANWTSHFINSKYKSVAAGNSYISPFLKVLNGSKKLARAVVEIPSFALEFFGSQKKSADVAIITNLSQDHLNRHETMENYAKTKANIFKNQKDGQNLVLNFDNQWTDFFLQLSAGWRTRAKVWFFSAGRLPKNSNGVFASEKSVYFQKNGTKNKVLDIGGFKKEWGEHNVMNLLASSFAAYLSGIPWQEIQKRTITLPQIPFRQEVVFQNKKIKIINDTAATSSEGGIAAIKRFGSPRTVLITGGTDRQLNFDQWAKVAAEGLRPENVIFISGSATAKMLKFLGRRYDRSEIHETLADCIKAGLKKAKKYSKATLLFSPAAKSFEKFKNEFDRGKKFNRLVSKLLK